MNKFYLILIGLVVFLTSCTKDEKSDSGIYSKGIFIVNEGKFQGGTGTITHLDETTNVLSQDIFSKENNGLILGNIAQSMIKFGGLYFIAVNNAATIHMVNESDFKSVGEIKNIQVPRYFATNGNKLYLSSWGSDFNSGKIYQLDATTKTVVDSIVTGGAPETMIFNNDNLYVTVVSTYLSKSKSVIVIDTKTNKIIKTIAAEDNPNAITKDINGNIWVLCSGNIDYVDPSKSTFGSMVKISNDIVTATYKLEFEAKGLAINSDGQRLFFIMDNKVFAHDISDTIFEKESIIDGNFYSIAYQKGKNKLFLTDAKDFSSIGEALIFDLSLKTTTKLITGVAPGFTYFAE